MTKKGVGIKPKGLCRFYSYVCDNGGVGYIRSIFPTIAASAIKYKGLHFDGQYGAHFITDKNFYSDVAFVRAQRSATPQHLYFIRHIKSMGIPVYYDLDDHLLAIPPTNHAYNYYETYYESVKMILREVSGITASTKYLAGVLKEYNENISIVKNYLLRSLWGHFDFTPRKDGEKLRIIYPGSSNHFACDLAKEKKGGDFSDKLIQFIKNTSDKYDWIIVGGYPKELENLLFDKRATYIPWINLFDYPRKLKELNPHIGIAPLEVNDFNRAKSNIKFMEYTALGIPGIYADLEPYTEAICKTNDDDQLFTYIEQFDKNEDYRYKTWKQEREKLNKYWLEDHVIDWVNGHLILGNKRFL